MYGLVVADLIGKWELAYEPISTPTLYAPPKRRNTPLDQPPPIITDYNLPWKICEGTTGQLHSIASLVLIELQAPIASQPAGARKLCFGARVGGLV